MWIVETKHGKLKIGERNNGHFSTFNFQIAISSCSAVFSKFKFMQNLFHTGVSDGIIDRLSRLQPSALALWGKMNVGQMLSHCQAPLQVAIGEIQIKRRFIGFLFGRIAKLQFMKEGPFKKNLPTDKSFIRKSEYNFYQEREKLQLLVKQFAKSDSQMMASKVHPFFGKMSVDEWGFLTWKHLDHHLTQFGV